MRFDRDRVHDPRACDDADAVRKERDERAERIAERALPDRKTEQHDVAGHHGGEDVETKKHHGIDGPRGEGQGDEKQVPPTGVVHGQLSASSAITSGSARRSWSKRVGDVSRASPWRSMKIVRNPSAAAGRMS